MMQHLYQVLTMHVILALSDFQCECGGYANNTRKKCVWACTFVKNFNTVAKILSGNKAAIKKTAQEDQDLY